MNEVLGTTAGNAVEIEESVLYLRNEHRESRLDDVVLSLCAEMLVIGGIEPERAAARARCEEAVSSGKAAEVFARMVAALGGPADFMDRYDTYLPRAAVTHAVHVNGTLAAVDTRAVGNTIIELGGGRRQVGEVLDLSVGLTNIAPIGAELGAERPLAVIHAASMADAEQAEKRLLAACRVEHTSIASEPVICEILSS